MGSSRQLRLVDKALGLLLSSSSIFFFLRMDGYPVLSLATSRLPHNVTLVCTSSVGGIQFQLSVVGSDAVDAIKALSC
jgi:hypothetical protein